MEQADPSPEEALGSKETIMKLGDDERYWIVAAFLMIILGSLTFATLIIIDTLK